MVCTIHVRILGGILWRGILHQLRLYYSHVLQGGWEGIPLALALGILLLYSFALLI